MSTTTTLYHEKIESIGRMKAEEQRNVRLILWARLVTFVAAVASLFVLWPYSVALAAAVSLSLLALFGAVVVADIRIQRRIRHYDRLTDICRNELQALDGRFGSFDDGAEYATLSHPYAFDLDIFGQQSIFQMVCRTKTMYGKDKLARRLLAPLPLTDIPENQEAVAELRDQLDWRLNLIASASDVGSDSRNLQHLSSWIATENRFEGSRFLQLALYVAPVATIILIVLSVAGVVSGAIPALMLVLYGFIYSKYGRHITRIHSLVSRMIDELKSLSATLTTIEGNTYRSKRLVALTRELECDGKKPSAIIREFTALVQQLDSRSNVAFMLLAGFYLLWDVKAVVKLERWKSRYGSAISRWIDVTGEIEALASLATLAFNNPDWCQPTVSRGYFSVDAAEAGHPIIPQKSRVCNTFAIAGGEAILLTGSNMAGKSTFLRTLGVNMVLAYAGSAVCAARFDVSYAPIRTSMRITDSLVENTSSFYAEIKRLGEIVAAVKGGEKPFLLLDEILRGTNSNDRHIGSLALIDLLAECGISGIIATHDLALTDARQKYPEALRNYHFDVQVDRNDELYFDYKIKQGICTSLNASILMRKIGLRV